MNPTAQLLRGGQALPPDQPIPLGPDGTRLRIDVPAGQRLAGAELRLVVPDDSAPITLTNGSVVTTDRGAGPPPADQPVRWVSHDWRASRGLVRIAVTVKTGADATHVRLRLSDGGPWLLASPGPLIELKPEGGALLAAANLPGLTASRVLVELVVKSPNAYSPEDHPLATSSVVLGLVVTGARRPPALTVRLGEAILRHEPGLLPAGGALSVALSSALRDLLPGTAGGVAEVLLEAPAESALQRIDLSLRTQALVTRFAPGDEVAGEVKPGGELVADVALAVAPTRLRARLRVDLHDEYRLPVPAPPAEPRHGHRCTPDSALAQRLALPAGDALLGVDLLLGPRTAALRGRVAFHADDGGLPQEPPFAAADLALADIPGAGVAATARPVAVDLPAPARPPGERCWVSLTLAEGEALWFFAAGAPGTPGPVRRERAEPWVPRDMAFTTGFAAPWAWAGPRLRRHRAPDPPDLVLRWGPAEVPAAVDAQGRVDLDAGDLPPAPPQPAPLRLVARCTFAARVALAELSAELPEQTFNLSFGT